MHVTGGVHLLTIEPGLGEHLSESELAQARDAVVLAALDLSTGDFDMEDARSAEGVAGHCWGILVVSGTMLNRVQVMGRMCSRVFGASDLSLLDGPIEESVPTEWLWTVRQPVRILLLDDRMVAAAQRWPPLLRAVHERAAQIARQGFINRAISQLPRVEDRLIGFLWTLADRRGIVRPDGVWVEVPLTQDELGELIGARRPTISLGLRKLADDGLITAGQGGYLLDRSSLDPFLPSGADS